MFFLDVSIEAVRNGIEEVFAYAANEAIGLHVFLDTFQLVTKFTKSVDNQTLNDGQQNDNDEEEEGDVEEDAVDFVIVAIWRFDFVTDTTTSSYTLVNVEDEAGQHVVTLPVDVVVFLLDVELAEEVEGDDRVDVHDDGQQHERQDELLAVVGDRLKDGP